MIKNTYLSSGDWLERNSHLIITISIIKSAANFSMYHNGKKIPKISGITGINKTILDGTFFSSFFPLESVRSQVQVFNFFIDYIKRNYHINICFQELWFLEHYR